MEMVPCISEALVFLHLTPSVVRKNSVTVVIFVNLRTYILLIYAFDVFSAGKECKSYMYESLIFICMYCIVYRSQTSGTMF